MIAAKKYHFTQWKVVICRVYVDGVRGHLAKSLAHKKRAKERFEEKSEEGGYIAHSLNWLPQQDSLQEEFYPRHKLSLVKPVRKQNGCLGRSHLLT